MEDKKQNTFGWILLGLLLGIITCAAGLLFFNSSRGRPAGTSSYDTGENSGGIPSVGDYLFGQSGQLLSGSMSGDSLTGASGQDLVYPLGYMDQFNKALLILQNDTMVNTYIDTENLISSGFNLVSINTSYISSGINADYIDPKFQLQGSADSSIDKLFMIGVNSDGAYSFEPITSNGNSWKYDLNPNHNNIKPGNNTYYLIGRTIDSNYVLQYITIKTLEGAEFYNSLDKICILDVCTDPDLPKPTIAGEGIISQKAIDGSKVIVVIPEKSIIITKTCSNGNQSIEKIINNNDSYRKVFIPCDIQSEGISQSFVDKNNNPISVSTQNAGIPGKLQFGNLKYISPKLSFKNTIKKYRPVEVLTNESLSSIVMEERDINNELAFRLIDDTFVTYTLDTSALKFMRYSNPDGTYKVIPKVASRMNKPIVYTVPATDVGLHDSIVANFVGSTIINTIDCPDPKKNDTPAAKFGIFPINNEFDIVGFWNCYMVQ